MRDILEDLLQTRGVKGAAVVTLDGMVVAEMLEDRLRSDVMSGLTSFLVSSVNHCLADADMGSMESFSLHCTHGQVILMGLGEAFLVVMLDQFADLANCQAEVRTASHALARIAKIRS